MSARRRSRAAKATVIGVVIDYSDRSWALTCRLYLSGPGPTRRSACAALMEAVVIREGQVAMTEPARVRVGPRAADPRGFCMRLAALGCL